MIYNIGAILFLIDLGLVKRFGEIELSQQWLI